MHQRAEFGYAVDVFALDGQVVDAVGARDAVEAFDGERAVDAFERVAGLARRCLVRW